MAPGLLSNADQFWGFDYSTLKHDVSWFGALAHPYAITLALLFYLLLSKQIVAFARDYYKINPKGKILNSVVIVHSALLAVYSIWTFVNSVPIVLKYWYDVGSFYGMVCDYNGELWNIRNLDFWITHFYISKIYEFVDTFVIVLKGRKPSFLQCYHHAGIALSMWGFVVTSGTVALFSITLNSFIHSLMYTYYVFAALGFRSKLKHILTQMQITQFVIGLAVSLPTHFIPSCLSPAQSLVLALMQTYSVILLILFVMFYRDSYLKKARENESKKKL